MLETIDCAYIKKSLVELSNRVLEAKDELNRLDAACGDGDFGSTMAAAFGEVKRLLEGDIIATDVGAIFTQTGNAIMDSAGGASGPTVAAIFLEAGEAAKGKSAVTLQDLASMFEGSIHKVQLLGGAKIGDKTLLDALDPAVRALNGASLSNESIRTGLQRASEASRLGCELTKGIVAKQGKARYLGEQTLGHLDPGARLVHLAFAALASAAGA